MEIRHNSEVLLDVVKIQEGQSSHSFNHFEGNSPLHQSSCANRSPYIKIMLWINNLICKGQKNDITIFQC